MDTTAEILDIKTTNVNKLCEALGLPEAPHNNDVVHFGRGEGHQVVNKDDKKEYYVDLDKLFGMTKQDRIKSAVSVLAVDLYSPDALRALERAGILMLDGELKTYTIWPKDNYGIIAMPSSGHFEAMVHLVSRSEGVDRNAATAKIGQKATGNDLRAFVFDPKEISLTRLLETTTSVVEQFEKGEPLEKYWRDIGEVTIKDLASQMESQKTRISQIGASNSR